MPMAFKLPIPATRSGKNPQEVALCYFNARRFQSACEKFYQRWKYCQQAALIFLGLPTFEAGLREKASTLFLFNSHIRGFICIPFNAPSLMSCRTRLRETPIIFAA
jgi:hypothetical protein